MSMLNWEGAMGKSDMGSSTVSTRVNTRPI